jgi:hypothetical protein
MTSRQRRLRYVLALVGSAFAMSALLPFSDVIAAPAPWGIAIHERTRACSAFWYGDEFTGYQLTPGWKAYYPMTVKRRPKDVQEIVTPHGRCVFEIGKERQCCAALKLKYRAMTWPSRAGSAAEGAAGGCTLAR